jgi:hypothetical protein
MCDLAVNSYAAALKAYGDVGRRISAAISKQQMAKPAAAAAAAAADVVRARDQSVKGVACAAAADVVVDHHLLAAAIQTQVRQHLNVSKLSESASPHVSQTCIMRCSIQTVIGADT